jgi:diguanylate cyclase (GGDEF)-like protein
MMLTLHWASIPTMEEETDRRAREGTVPDAPSPPRHIAGTTTRIILGYVEREAGPDGLARFLELAGLRRSIETLRDESVWISYGELVALLEAAVELFGDRSVPRRMGEDTLDYRESSPLLPLFQALGSPAELCRNITLASAKFQSIGVAEVLETGDEHAVVSFSTREGFDRHPLHCDYLIGMLTVIPRVFGLAAADVEHDECQALGASRCVYRVTWVNRPPETGLAERLVHLEERLELVTRQFEELQSTSADLVSADDVDTVLRRIAQRAAAAVRAPGFVLAVRMAGGRVRVVAAGVAAEEAAAVAGEMLGSADPSAPTRLVAAVESAQRTYGSLAALYPEEGGFFPEEQRLLAAYARHAAAALDAATALEAARERERTATLLLELARALADATTQEEVCHRVVEAAPGMGGAAWAGVYLWDSALHLAVADGPVPAAPLVASLFGLEGRRPDGHGLPRTTTVHVDGRTSVLAPVVARSIVLGVVATTWEAPSAPEVEDPAVVARLSGVADQAATALLNASLLAQVRHQALHDALTGLPNSVLFSDRAAQVLAAIARDGGRAAVCFVDLDRFKEVNDSFGHAAGDELLAQVASRLRTTVRAVDTVARLSGDEFAILVPDVVDTTAVVAVAEKVLAALRRPYTLEGASVTVTPSIGIALAPDDGDEPRLLLQKADVAMYRAKGMGRDRWALFAEPGTPGAATA